ncbi:hypothetical protein Q3G72_025288 [Acer saccharum]|nr:hypothetical protein Q3G72_025288 [Acer saccharum]
MWRKKTIGYYNTRKGNGGHHSLSRHRLYGNPCSRDPHRSLHPFNRCTDCICYGRGYSKNWHTCCRRLSSCSGDRRASHRSSGRRGRGRQCSGRSFFERGLNHSTCWCSEWWLISAAQATVTLATGVQAARAEGARALAEAFLNVAGITPPAGAVNVALTVTAQIVGAHVDVTLAAAQAAATLATGAQDSNKKEEEGEIHAVGGGIAKEHVSSVAATLASAACDTSAQLIIALKVIILSITILVMSILFVFTLVAVALMVVAQTVGAHATDALAAAQAAATLAIGAAFPPRR